VGQGKGIVDPDGQNVPSGQFKQLELKLWPNKLLKVPG